MYLLTLVVSGNAPCWDSDNMSSVRVGAILHPQSSLFLLFSWDCLFPGRPGKCQGLSKATSSTEANNVLPANSSSSVNIWAVVVLLLFVDCTNYVHVLMGFWRALFMQSGSGHTGYLCCVVCLFRTWEYYSGKKKWIQISLCQWVWFLSLGCKCLLPATGCWDEGESFDSITEHHRAAECAWEMLGRWVGNLCTFWACTGCSGTGFSQMSTLVSSTDQQCFTDGQSLWHCFCLFPS